MGVLRWLKDWFTAQRRPNEATGHPDLYPIDLEKIAKELNISVRAKELGERGLPACDAKALASPEQDIIATIEKRRQGIVNWAARRLDLLSAALAKRQVVQQVNQARQADQEFARQASLQLADFEARLKNSGKQARIDQEELERFRLENHLIRQSRHHSDARRFLTFALVALFIILEGAANAFTFAQGLDSGWLGGLVQALLSAAINVVVSFVIGKFLVRQAFHRKWFRKAMGFAAVALGLAFICLMALLITHYRDSLSAGIDDAAAAALRSLLERPLSFADIFSILLCVLSLFFGLAALVDGLFSDDLYPGYGAVSRRAKRSIDDYEADLDEAREELDELKQETLAGFDDALSRSQGLIAAFQIDIDNKRATAFRVSTAMQNADHSLRALLRRFRDENEMHRGGAKRPAYFDDYPSLEPVPLPSFDVEPDLASLKVQRTLVGALVAEAQDIRARIQASFSQQFDSLKSLDIHFPSQKAN